MTFIHVLILGVVEGITEFLPISSTAHLILTTSFLKIHQTDQVALFQIVIQCGAILAVVALFWKKIQENPEIFKKVCVAFLPTALMGYIFHSIVKTVLFESTFIISLALIIVGILFLVIEWLIVKGLLKNNRDISSLTYSEVLLIGIIQGIAIIPGISRAGAVIIGMMAMKFKRTDSALFSFLLAVPTIAAASLFELININQSLITGSLITSLIIGSIVACISALLVVKWLIKYLQNHSLIYFGIYRIILGILLLLIGSGN